MKVLVTDFDKTFYLNNEDIEINKRLVKEFRKNGNLVIFATGRSEKSFQSQKEKFDLEYDYLILNHGAVVMDSMSNVVKYEILDSSIIDKIVPYLNIEKSQEFYYCNVDSDKVVEKTNIVKIHVKYNDYNTLKEIHDVIKEKFDKSVNVYMASRRTLEIVSKSSSKLRGIKFLVNALNLDENNIYTIGDGESDIEMVQEYKGGFMAKSIYNFQKSDLKKYEKVSDLINEIL